MKMKKSTIALLVSTLTCSIAVSAVLLNEFNKNVNNVQPEPAPFAIEESVEAREDVFGGDESLFAGYLGQNQSLAPKMANGGDRGLSSLLKPKIGHQHLFIDQDNDNEPDHISIRFMAAIGSLNVEATWTRAMYKENGDAYSGLTEANKGVTKAYTGLTNNGVITYATSIKDENNNYPYSYFVVYTLLNIPLDGYGKYYLDASLSISFGGESITSSVGAIEVDTEDFFTYERGTLSALEFSEVNDRELSVKGKENSEEESIEIPAYANDGNGRYPVVEVQENGFENFDSVSNLILPHGITHIRHYAFSGTKITSLVVPNSVVTIDEYAFSQCKSLVSATIPSSVTSVARGLFKGCSALETVDYDARALSNMSFTECNSLTSFHIGSHVEWIETQCFYQNTSLTSLFIPNTVTYVRSQAFDLMYNAVILIEEGANVSSWHSTWNKDQTYGKCFYVLDVDSNYVFDLKTSSDNNYQYIVINDGALLTKYLGSNTDVTVPSSVDGHTVAGLYKTFASNFSVTRIVLPAGLTEVGNGAFYQCSNLETIVLPTSVEIITDDAFVGCSRLANINISACTSLKKVGEDAFRATNIQTITFQPGLEEIGQTAFVGWKGKTIYIPETVTYIGSNTFWECPNLETIYYEGEDIPDTWHPHWNYGGYGIKPDYLHKYFVYSNGLVLKTVDGGYQIKSYENQENTALTIPSEVNGQSIISIASYCFAGSNITSLVVPNSVVTIDEYAFSQCKSLVSATIPSSVTSVARGLFKGCSALETVDYDARALSNMSFTECNSLTSFHIGSHVEWIETQCFYQNTSLTSLFIPNTVTYVRSQAFDLMYNAVILIEEGANVSSWHSTWNKDQTYGKCFYVLDVDSNYVFDLKTSSDNNYQYIVINDGALLTKYLGSNTDVTVPSSVDGHTVAGLYKTFASNFSVTRIVLPAGLTEVGNGAFYQCSNLETIVLPTSVEIITDDAFVGCSRLANINISACTSLKKVGEDAFRATNIQTITFQPGLEEIGQTAFVGWKGKTIYIPETVTYIGSNTFWECPNLETIYYEGEDIPDTWHPHWNYGGYQILFNQQY